MGSVKKKPPPPPPPPKSSPFSPNPRLTLPSPSALHVPPFFHPAYPAHPPDPTPLTLTPTPIPQPPSHPA